MDLYNIPGDDGKYWRMDKLIECKQMVEYADVPVIAEYSKHLNTPDEAILVAWFFSMTYSEPSAFWLLDNLDYYHMDKAYLNDFWRTYKEKIPFNSSRRYCRNMDWFVPLMSNFMAKTKRHPYRWFKSLYDESDSPEDKYKKIYSELIRYKFMGRFSTELFMWAIDALSQYGLIPKVYAKEPPFSWKNGSNVTSGMLNLIYLDEEANLYDKTKQLNKNLEPLLDEGLEKLYERCKYKNVQVNDYSTIIPRICSFRNLFKANRYMGYHQDRQLEGMLKLSKLSNTDISSIEKLYAIRKNLYSKELLGELNDWTGIRKERKKLFLTTGRIL